MSSLLLPTIASASPESRELVRQGLAAVKARQFEAALEKFEAAGAADPTDAEAVFFQGLALNLLDRPAEALARLERAAAMGARHPDLAFQTGWSLLRLRRWEDAIVQLDRYERDHPGRGKTKEFLGRAYLGRGQLDRAEAALREAIRRDARLSPSAQLHLAVVAQRRGDPEAA
ncbi:MAG: tetratricopeptide repeat protein, partial [Candidatus Rokubacteria bacterium]|nr:tetratricopeptide repeat protein [Candidatus Rokubacteria bacterium]